MFNATYVASAVRIAVRINGVLQVRVPWADPLSRYTTRFERLVNDWLQDSSVSTVAPSMSMSWTAITGILQRAVEHGLARKKKSSARLIAIDKTSFQKRLEYVTIITNQQTGAVEFIADGRSEESIHAFFKELGKAGCNKIRSISMDMRQAYINAVTAFVSKAVLKICFDKFHTAQYVGNAVDKVRRKEHRELMNTGDERLKGTRNVSLELCQSNMAEKAWQKRITLSRFQKWSAAPCSRHVFLQQIGFASALLMYMSSTQISEYPKL